jgi:hypothetical protein
MIEFLCGHPSCAVRVSSSGASLRERDHKVLNTNKSTYILLDLATFHLVHCSCLCYERRRAEACVD